MVRGLVNIKNNLERSDKKEKLTQVHAKDMLSRITGTTNMKLAAVCDLVRAIDTNLFVQNLGN